MDKLYNPHPGVQSELMTGEGHLLKGGDKIIVVHSDGELSRRIQMLVQAAQDAMLNVVVISSHSLKNGRTGKFDHFPDFIVDELHHTEPRKLSPKRKALLAQLERAKVRRDKNAIRDLTRQLEQTW